MPIYTPDQVLAMGKPTTKTAPKGKVLSISDIEKMLPAQSKSPSASQKWQAAASDVKDFVVNAAKEYNTAEQEGMHHPVDFSWGMAKGLLSGMIDLGSLSIEGLSGGAKALMGMSEKEAGKNFQKGMEAGKKLVDKVAPAIQKHLKEKGKPEEAAVNALGIIPQGIQAAGDAGFDVTNSPLVGATTQAVGTLVSLLGLKGLKDPLAALRARKPGESPKPVEPPATPTPNEDFASEFSDEELSPEDEAPATKAAREHTPPKETNVKGIKSSLEAKLKGIEGEQESLQHRMMDLTHRRHELGLSPEQADLQKEALIRKHEALEKQAVPLREKLNSFPIEPPTKPAAVSKPGEPSLEELTAGLWDMVRKDKEALLQPQSSEGIRHEADETGLHTVTSSNGQSLAQESGKYLIEKRTDTAEKAQGKGEGVARLERLAQEAKKRNLTLGSDISVSPAAEKLWRSLGKKGYEIKMNPAERNPVTGNLVSKEYGKPVFEAHAKTATPKPDPVMFQENGQLVRRSTVQHAFNIGQKGADALPGSRIVQGKIRQYIEEIQRHIAPESLGPGAKAAAAILAKNIAESQMKEANFQTKSAPRRAFWNSRMDNAQEFIQRYEKGGKFEDPMLQEAAEAYRAWNAKVASQDAVNHIEYEPVDNYLYHTFEDGDQVAEFLGQRYRAKWGDPGFTKDRVFDLYEQAIKAGYKPRFTNPEDIMLARQHASDIAHMKIQALRDLADAGLAVQIRKGMKAAPDGFTPGEFRAPNGERYWVSKNAAQILHNAWNTTSLWQARGIAGDAFRGAMFLKNTLVPFKLGFSLFHPLHVATIDNATGMVRASKELLSGRSDPVTWFKHMVKSAAYLDSIHQTRSGYRLMKLWQGRVPEGELTDADRQSLQWMAEGGFVPEMPIQYRTGALAKFRDAVQRHSLTAAWHAPFAVLDAIQKPLFQVWIPSLKTASFLADAKSAIAADPTLLDNPLKRQVAFRKLAKSVDNRYGEMAYSTLFWNRMVKDIAVANTLSLGWQLGFLREYGGAASDLGSSLLNKGKLSAKARAGLLDRPLFALFYTTQALTYGGLLTWAMTGKHPTQTLDYVYPRVGTDQEGKAKRVSTMFYPREFWAIAKHVQNQGALGGLENLVRSKSSGVMGLIGEWATGVNGLGQQIRDPNAPAFKKLEQTLANSLSEFEPISIEATHRQGKGMLSKEGVMNTAGFTPAPRYITETPAQSYIQRIYDQSYQGKETPYEQVERSKDTRALRQAYQDADQDKFNNLLDKMRAKYKLSANEEQRLIQSLDEPPSSAYIKMFKRLKWQDQKRALDKMTQDERDIFLPVSNVDHLRYTYTPPEDQQ